MTAVVIMYEVQTSTVHTTLRITTLRYTAAPVCVPSSLTSKGLTKSTSSRTNYSSEKQAGDESVDANVKQCERNRSQ